MEEVEEVLADIWSIKPEKKRVCFSRSPTGLNWAEFSLPAFLKVLYLPLNSRNLNCPCYSSIPHAIYPFWRDLFQFIIAQTDEYT
jgi:hypothetical protein